MNRESRPIPEPVAQLQRQLEQFRSAQPGRTKLPESLWQSAVELARQHGVYPVAHPLRLDYTRLKERLGGSPTVRRKATQPAFVELVAPSRAQLEECVIEFAATWPKLTLLDETVKVPAVEPAVLKDPEHPLRKRPQIRVGSPINLYFKWRILPPNERKGVIGARARFIAKAY